MADLLELDAEIVQPYLAELIGWLATLIAPEPNRILDLGSGPGTGTFALARRFQHAHITAVDISPHMLHRVQQQAATQGVADRVRTVRASLDDTVPASPDGQAYDLMWAAHSLHHLADPGHTLALAFDQLRPGGLLAVTEMDGFPRLLPTDVGLARPALEARLRAATDQESAHEWTDHLEAAGFTIAERHTVELNITAEQAGPALNRYAHGYLATLRGHAEGLLAADDLTVLDTLLDDADPAAVARRDDLALRSVRTTWIARRP